MRKHAGTSYACDVCNKKYARKEDLKNHFKQHWDPVVTVEAAPPNEAGPEKPDILAQAFDNAMGGSPMEIDYAESPELDPELWDNINNIPTISWSSVIDDHSTPAPVTSAISRESLVIDPDCQMVDEQTERNLDSLPSAPPNISWKAHTPPPGCTRGKADTDKELFSVRCVIYHILKHNMSGLRQRLS